MNFTIFVICIVIFFIGVSVGFLLRKWVLETRAYSGVIHVNKNDDRLLYSLELQSNPEDLQFRNEVIFKVETSDKSSNRS